MAQKTAEKNIAYYDDTKRYCVHLTLTSMNTAVHASERDQPSVEEKGEEWMQTQAVFLSPVCVRRRKWRKYEYVETICPFFAR